MAALKRLAHNIGVACAIETVICTAIGETYDSIYYIAGTDITNIDKIRHAKFARDALTSRIDINTNNFVSADEPRTLNHIKTDPTETEDSNISTRLNTRCPDHSANTSGNAAANITSLIKGCIFANFGN